MMLDTPDSEEKVMKIMTSSSAKMSAMGESLEKEAAADNETRRLGKEAMRKRGVSSHHSGSREGMTTTTFQDREAARRMKDKNRNITPTKSGGANNYKLPTRPADGSGTGI